MLSVSLPMVMTPALNMLFLVLVARNATVSEYGGLSYSIALMAIVIGFSDLGLRDFFLSKDGKDKSYCDVIVLFSVSVVIFLFLVFLNYFLFLEEGALLIFSALLFEGFALGVFYKVIYYHYQSIGLVDIFSRIDVLLKMTPVALKISLIFIANDIFYSVLLGSALSILMYGSWALKIRNEFDSKSDFLLSKLMLLVKNWPDWSVYTVSFISFFLYFGADRLVVGSVLGIEELAVYSAAMSFMSIGQIAVGVLWSLYMPRLSRGEKIWSYRHFMIITTCLGVLGVIAYQIVAYFILDLIYPVGYAGASLILSIGSIYFIFRYPNVVMEINYITSNKYGSFVKKRVAFGLFSIALSLALLPTFGAVGAALSLAVSEMLLMCSALLGIRSQR